MKQNKSITIFVPTYNRPGYLKRLLSYYNDYQIPYKIIIADGSIDEIKRANRQTVSSFPALNILHLDNYSSETSSIVRVNDAMKHVDTKYIVFCADDDFVTPNGIEQSMDFLEANPDYTIAHGRYISFQLENDTQGRKTFRYEICYSPEILTSDDPVERLHQHLSRYTMPTLYAVHKTELLRMILVENYRFSDVKESLLPDSLGTNLDVITGKMKCLDILYCARDGESGRTGSFTNIKELTKAGLYDKLYAEFIKCMAIYLSKASKLSLDESIRLVNKWVKAHNKKYGSKKPLTLMIAWLGRMLDKVALPHWLKKLIRKTYAILTGTMKRKKQSEFQPQSSLEDEDIDKIRQHVLSFSTKSN